MSLILDALNRAEQERRKAVDSSPAPALSGAADVPDKAADRKIPVMVFMSLVLVVVMGVGYWNGFNFSKAQTAPIQPPSVSIPLPEPAVEVTHSALPEQDPLNIDSTNDAQPKDDNQEIAESKIKTLDKDLSETDTAAKQATDSAQSHQESIQAAALQQVDALYQEETESEGVPQAPLKVVKLYEPDVVDQKPATAVLDEPVRSYSLPAPEPISHVQPDSDSIASLFDVVGFADIPWQTKMAIPSINYSQHNYREGGDSSIMINGVILRAGEKLDELTLEQIRRDGCVLVFRGTRFTLAALSGWINL